MSSRRTIALTLPVPPSPNAMPAHPQARHRAKNRYRKAAWARAVTQHPPAFDPPERVVLTATFHLVQFRDEDNLAGSLKWPLDTLRQHQTGKLHWRQGVRDTGGYFVDDNPEHLEIGLVDQTRACTRDEERLVLVIMEAESLRETARERARVD